MLGSFVQDLSKMFGVDRVQVYPLHTQANGTVERYNRTL